MQLLKERILKDGVVKPGNILKVDSFLNHQMDIDLINEIGKEFKARFSDPMWPVTLSGRLLIVALVGRYPANWLIRRGSISHHRSFSHRTMRYCALMRY